MHQPPGARPRGAEGARRLRRRRSSPPVPTNATWHSDVPGRGRRRRVTPVWTSSPMSRTTRLPDLTGKTVVVVGGGNVAMDAARVPLGGSGAAEAEVAYRRGRDEMPAHHVEVDEAEAEGAVFEFLVAPARGPRRAGGKVSGLRCQRMRLGEADASGRRRPEPVPGSESYDRVRHGGLGDRHGARRRAVRAGRRRRARASGSRSTRSPLQTEIPYLFAAGDVEIRRHRHHARPSAHGRRAAYMIDNWLQRAAARRLPALRRPAGRGRARRGARPADRLRSPQPGQGRRGPGPPNASGLRTRSSRR